MSAANEFIARWKKSDSKPFDEQAKLKEARSLLVKGAVSQDEFDEMSQYCAQRNPKRSEADKKGVAAIKAAPAAGGAGAAEEPTMEGFLLKRTADGSSWKKLYFKLFEDRLEFSAKRESAALGKLLLGKEFFVADSILRRIKNMRQNGFMVSDLGGPASTFYLAADSPENKTYWIHTIGSVLRKLKEADPAEARLSRGRAGSDAAERDYQQRLASAGKLGREDSVKSAANRRSLVEMSVVEAGRKPKGGKKGGEAGKVAAKAELRLSTSVASGRGGRLSGPRGAAAAAAAAAGGGRSSRQKGGAHARASTMRAGSMDSAAEEDKHHADKAAPLQKASSRVQSLTRNEKTMSTASAAMSAHESARESVRSNLGLNVMSFGEQEDLHDKAAEAERVRALKTMENTAAAQRLAAASAEKRELKAELKRAKDSKDESLIASAEAAYLEAKHEERDAQNALVRSAAERTEAADVNRTTEHILAEAQAANSIVLELSKLDPAALADGDKDKARARVQQAAGKVREEALADARAKQKEIEAAEAKARKAEAEAADRAERERKATETLGGKKAADDKTRKAAQAVLDETTKARAEADRLRKLAELDAARLEREKMDAIAKADAVEKALKATQELLEKERAKNSNTAKQHQQHQHQQPQDDLGFAALRKDKEEEHRRQAVQRRTSAGKPGPQDKPAAKDDKRRSSLMNRLLPSRPAGAGAKPANPAVGKGGAAAAAAAAPPRAPANASAHKRPENPAVAAANASDSGPIEASDSFATFLNGWTGGWAGSAAQGAAEGLEYLTGLRLASDGDESTIGDSSTLDGRAYHDEFDSDEDEDEQDDYHSEDEGAAYDNKLSAVTEDERRKAAKAWIEFEMNRLTDIIEEVGIEDEYGRPTVSFGQLLDIYESISDTLVGILIRAKKAGRVWYDGDVLFEVEHDNVVITLVDPEDDA
jgi:hypothetical protein